MKRIVLPLVILLLTISRPTYADPINGLDLMGYCGKYLAVYSDGLTSRLKASTMEAEHAGQCIGYVEAASIVGFSQKLYCPSEDIPPRQIVLIVKKYMDSHPEVLNKLGAVVIWQALAATYPCSQKSP